MKNSIAFRLTVAFGSLVILFSAAIGFGIEHAHSTMFTLCAIAVAIAGVLVWLTVRGIRRSLARVIQHCEQISKGDFSGDIQVHSEDEIGQVLAALKETQSALRGAALRAADSAGQIAAIDRSLAVIEFDLEGHILQANENYLRTMSYTESQLKGQHQSILLDPAEGEREHYREFWAGVARGKFESGTFKRLARGGREVWLQGSFNPILDASGKPYKVVGYSSDVTEQVRMKEGLDHAVTETQAAVQSAINGDLTVRVPVKGKTGQIESLARSANALIENMMGVVSTIKQATDQVQNSASEISSGNMNLSQRTEEQASSLEETAASMEEMTSTVRTTAENASQARQLAIAAQEKAHHGGEVVIAAVAAMDGINDSSRKIADIIGVIDDIAFQTNLLALNAAVEAARAGEQGRGFAVVATEVRNLAGRSATAAKEIKALIQDGVMKIEDGGKLVSQSGQALHDISAAVKRVADVVAEIAQASQAQASGIEQVNRAVTQMDETTQQNAALVEEAAAASQAIVAQATSLAEQIAQYRVAGGAAVGVSSRDDYPVATARAA